MPHLSAFRSAFKTLAILAPAVVLLAAGNACTTAQAPPPAAAPAARPPVSPELYATIARLDSAMFDAFNRRDLGKLQTYFSEDLEFFHDKGGLADYKQSMEGFRALFEQARINGLNRRLVPGSLEVYPINGYGAVETCQHRFCHVENGKDDCGTFKNVMVWQQKNGQWKVTRVVSYGH